MLIRIKNITISLKIESNFKLHDSSVADERLRLETRTIYEYKI
jgi:hypothetical protein